MGFKNIFILFFIYDCRNIISNVMDTEKRDKSYRWGRGRGFFGFRMER
jgi:hypothetical protein